jgi:hypothetical protein
MRRAPGVPSRFAPPLTMRVGGVSAGVALTLGILGGCGSKATTGPALQPLDLTPVMGEVFNHDEIIPLAGFTDALSFSPAEIEGFLSMNPYGTTSFLSTYQSSGIFAAASIAAASAKYGINPIVFLIRAEIDGGLIGATTYPLPADQVEYVFGCGCNSSSVCDPSFAGFDRQVDCLGSTLRTSLDQIAMSGQTAGGWAPARIGVTLDDVEVTPTDASTAALYQYDPVVGQGKSDNWLVWNLWNLYSNFLSYFPPPDSAADATAQIGDACFAASACAFANPICATGKNYPGGLCTSKCNGACEGNDSYCADFGTSGYCLAICNPTDPASCRAGYSCTLIHQYKNPDSTAANNVCAPM